MGAGACRGPARRGAPVRREPRARPLGLPVVRGMEEEPAAGVWKGFLVVCIYYICVCNVVYGNVW